MEKVKTITTEKEGRFYYFVFNSMGFDMDDFNESLEYETLAEK